MRSSPRAGPLSEVAKFKVNPAPMPRVRNAEVRVRIPSGALSGATRTVAPGFRSDGERLENPRSIGDVQGGVTHMPASGSHVPEPQSMRSIQCPVSVHCWSMLGVIRHWKSGGMHSSHSMSTASQSAWDPQFRIGRPARAIGAALLKVWSAAAPRGPVAHGHRACAGGCDTERRTCARRASALPAVAVRVADLRLCVQAPRLAQRRTLEACTWRSFGSCTARRSRTGRRLFTQAVRPALQTSRLRNVATDRVRVAHRRRAHASRSNAERGRRASIAAVVPAVAVRVADLRLRAHRSGAGSARTSESCTCRSPRCRAQRSRRQCPCSFQPVWSGVADLRLRAVAARLPGRAGGRRCRSRLELQRAAVAHALAHGCSSRCDPRCRLAAARRCSASRQASHAGAVHVPVVALQSAAVAHGSAVAWNAVRSGVANLRLRAVAASFSDARTRVCWHEPVAASQSAAVAQAVPEFWKPVRSPRQTCG